MVSAFALRSQIEAALADRIPSALTPQQRMIRPVVPTGVAAVDEAVGGGIPVGALTEIVGAECSGRTSLALGFLTEVMREGKVCAWVDVSDALSPESAAAAGVDLPRLLWVRCGVVREAEQRGWNRGGFALPQKYFVPPPPKKGLHGGGFGGHPRDEEKGMDAAVTGLFRPQAIAPRCAEPQRRVREQKPSIEPVAVAAAPANWGPRKKPWSRMDQALRATDLLLQAGGFGAIVLDMGSVAPEHVSRIPLATWFRYRAAAERTQACVLLLSQYACAKSSAELVLRLEPGAVHVRGRTVLTGFDHCVDVSRRRFEQEKVVPIRKPPQRAGVGVWRSRATWAGLR